MRGLAENNISPSGPGKRAKAEDVYIPPLCVCVCVCVCTALQLSLHSVTSTEYLSVNYFQLFYPHRL